LSLAAILVGSRDQRTHFWKGAIQESFQQSLVEIGSVVSEENFYSRWPLLLKIEISSNGQNCSILSQNVPKFELCKHNDELFSIYYRIFYDGQLKFHPPFFLF
jgi:hypothetical protein